MSDGDWSPNFGELGARAPEWKAKRPLRIALLGDFGGGALHGRLETGEALARRKPLRVEFDTLDDALARLDLQLPLPVGSDGAGVTVPIGELEAFHPDSLYREVEVFAALSALRKRLNQPATFAAAAAEVMAWHDGPRPSASRVATRRRARGATLAAGASQDDFARLTGRPPASHGDSDVSTLLKSVVGPFVVPAAHPDKARLIQTVDRALADAMRAILHHPDFQNVESLWRGVDFLVRRLETGPQLQVHLIDLSAEELAADLSSVDELSETGLYRLLVSKPAEDADGGYSYVGALYQFEAAPPQLELLGRLAHIATHAGAAVLTALDTDPLVNPKDPPHRLVEDSLAALRTSPGASALAMIGPRFLLRHPYGKRSDPISSFEFEEFSRSYGLRGMLWGHPALLALSVLGQPGATLNVDDLPFHHYVDADGDSVALPCTERLITLGMAERLRGFGMVAVMARKGEPMVRLAGLDAVAGSELKAAVGKKPTPPKPAPAPSAAAPAGSAPAPSTVAQDTADEEVAESVEDAAPAAAQEGGEAAAAAQEGGEAAAEAEAQPAADGGGTGDPELDALLASLGGASDEPETATSAPAEESAATEDDGMDPELAALLKSLG